MRNISIIKYTYIKSIMAGVCISLGCIIYLSIINTNKIVGAALFSIGLYSVIIFGFNLYTGKVCSKDSYKIPLYLPSVWIFNLVGCIIMSLLMVSHEQILNNSYLLVLDKLNKSYFTLFTDSIICGVCICISTMGYKNNPILPLFGVMVFILSGAEHTIADMCYILLAALYNTDILSWELLKFILIITIGNTIGGLLMGLSVEHK